MKLFTMYRRAVPTDTHDENQRNAPDEPQFQGVVFDDGRVAVRWLTAKRSVSVWDSVEDMLAIHGHPEYGSELVWHQPPYPEGIVVGPCVCGSWPGGECLRCPWGSVPTSTRSKA